MYPVCTAAMPNTNWSRRRAVHRRAAAQLFPLYGRRAKTSDRLALGLFEASQCSTRGPASSIAPRDCINGQRSCVPISVEQRENKEPGLAAATFGIVATCRCVPRGGQLSRAAARSGLTVADGRAQSRAGAIHRLVWHSLEASGGSVVGLVSTAWRSLSSSVPAVCRRRAALGAVRRAVHSRTVGPERAYSGGRITPGCTRRRRARVFQFRPW